MHLAHFSDINLDAFNGKNLALPTRPERFIETLTTESVWNEASDKIDHKLLPFARTDLFEVPLKSTEVLCQGSDFKKLVEIVFDIKSHPVDFLPGDTVGILPINVKDDVNFLLETLELTTQADNIIDVSILKTTKKKGARLPVYLPIKTTYKNLLTYHLNIHSVPKKLFIRALVDFAANETERLLLKVLCSKDGSEVYNEHMAKRGITSVELLKSCPSCKPPFGVLLEHLPRLLPRPYSIANSPLLAPHDIKIIFSVLENKPQKGLTTGMMESLAEQFTENCNASCTVSLYFRERNSFNYTEEDIDKNIVMIGVGCAISPFIGFMEHKSELEKLRGIKCDHYKTWLFSGAKYHHNSPYRERLIELFKAGVISEYFESFSREAESKFKYVQDQMVRNAERFVSLIMNPNTKIYVCADGSHISKSIMSCIEDCIKTVCKLDSDEAVDMLREMRTSGRYIEDLWL